MSVNPYRPLYRLSAAVHARILTGSKFTFSTARKVCLHHDTSSICNNLEVITQPINAPIVINYHFHTIFPLIRQQYRKLHFRYTKL